jgi:hypothetical protein
VLIREIERRIGNTYVSVDGDYFMLARCGNTSCLTRVNALPEEDFEPTAEDLHQYAQPPP